MSLLCVAVCAALCIVSGFGYDIGPLNSTVDIGSMYPKDDLTPEDTKASKNLIGLLLLVREFMPVGIADVVPSLDPYVTPQLPPAEFNLLGSDLKGTVELSNLVASGGQGFVLNNIEVRKNDMRLDFDVTVPQVVADIDYLTTNFMYKQFVFNTSGHIQLTLKNLRVEGAISFVAMSNGDYDFFSAIGLNVVNHAEVVQINKNIEDIPREVLDEVKDVLLRSVGNGARSQIDDILMHYSIEQVKKFLYGYYR